MAAAAAATHEIAEHVLEYIGEAGTKARALSGTALF